MFPSALPLSSNITLPLLHKPHILAFSFRPLSKSHVCFTFSSSNENPIGEEARWLREEQRWLREEQRWLREESRWNAERQALLQEINSLKLRIQELERLNSLQGASVSETVANIAKLLQVVKEADLGKNVNRIADSGTSAVPLVVEAAKEEEEVVIKEVISIPHKKEAVQKRATMRIGSEGDEVRAMQSANGVPVGAITEISEVEQTVVTEEGVAKVEVSQHRVFLLGENRWEEPSRLSGNSKRTVTKSTSGNVATKCLSCRGEGRLLCMECDGTGEPNVEPQFLEWVDEGSKCPYCEGLGYVTCDVCGGRTATAA
ncbi:UNVERIFIED_CONTAM: protein disulfide isomerase pTAC5, chloroplastic [Sesamum radiatum]|uniref:Protein disulfide isomerase pTAC5, chloroplastic n=1 Tax=Sesamum radiatum TaxID=300843 RepID=A0AAW2UET6_SESRA